MLFKKNAPLLHSKRFRESFTFLHILVVISKTIVVSHSQVYSQYKYILVNFTASRITLEKKEVTAFLCFICYFYSSQFENEYLKQT